MTSRLTGVKVHRNLTRIDSFDAFDSARQRLTMDLDVLALEAPEATV